MALIRPFRNSDTRDLAVAWQQHWLAAGHRVDTTSAQLEQAILDKPFFEYQHMLVIESQGKLLGFSHLQTDPSNDPPLRARIASFCVGDAEDRDSLARSLLLASMNLCASQGIREFEVGTVLGDLSGLVGLEPFGGVVGMLQTDQLVIGLMNEFQFQARPEMFALELRLDRFRPPMDRNLFMVRRNATIVERAQSLPHHWRAACAHSHFDITQFQLNNHRQQTLATATYYLADQDALVMDRSLLYLAGFDSAAPEPDVSSPPAPPENNASLSPETCYAVVGSLQMLMQRHFRNVRAIVDSAESKADARIAFLKNTGFEPVAVGQAYHKQLG